MHKNLGIILTIKNNEQTGRLYVLVGPNVSVSRRVKINTRSGVNDATFAVCTVTHCSFSFNYIRFYDIMSRNIEIIEFFIVLI